MFLANLNELHETKDPLMAVLVFSKFEFRNIPYSEDHVRRIFSGNGLNQKGLLNFAQRPEFQKEILKLIADFFDC